MYNPSFNFTNTLKNKAQTNIKFKQIPDLSLCSFNLNGNLYSSANTPEENQIKIHRRRNFVEENLIKKHDICFLQETHLNGSYTDQVWTKKSGLFYEAHHRTHHIFLNNDISHRQSGAQRGTAILIKKQIYEKARAHILIFSNRS